MKRVVLILMLAFCNCVIAQTDYSEIVTNMASALVSERGILNATFTNSLSRWETEVTNAQQAASVRLVRAIALADIAEEELNGDELLPQASLICSNIVNSADLAADAWQRGVSGIVLAGIYSFSGKRQLACHIATNAVVMSSHELATAEDACLWHAMAKRLMVDGLTVHEAIRCYAALSLLDEDASSDVSAYTNGLPDSVLVKIQELVD